MERELKQKLDTCLSDFISEDGLIHICIDACYDDAICANMAADIALSDDPEGALTDRVALMYDDYATERWNELIKGVMSPLAADDMTRKEIADYVSDLTVFDLPLDHFKKQVFHVPVMLDVAGDRRFHNDDPDKLYEKKIPEGSSVLWLVRQQGHTKEELEQALDTKFDPENVTFLSSVEQEIANCPASFPVLTFLLDLRLDEIIKINRLKKEDPDGTITISSNVMCGLSDPWNGGGSMLEIEPENDIVIPARYIWLCLPDTKYGPCHGYGIQNVYDLTGKAWQCGKLLVISGSEKEPSAAADRRDQWKLLDPDCLQYIRELEGGTWELYQIAEYEGPSEECRFKLCHGIIFRNEIDTDLLTDCYGGSYLEDLGQDKPVLRKEFAAALWFRLKAEDYYISYSCFSFNEAKEMIGRLTGVDTVRNTN